MDAQGDDKELWMRTGTCMPLIKVSTAQIKEFLRSDPLIMWINNKPVLEVESIALDESCGNPIIRIVGHDLSNERKTVVLALQNLEGVEASADGAEFADNDTGLSPPHGFCARCGRPKTDQLCVGNDECPEHTHACQGWGNHCCLCGASYAKGQI